MTKNPFINALAATAYIALVASLLFYGPKIADRADSVLAPIAMISLFTLSVAVMGYLFLYKPIELYTGNSKKEAVHLFLKTVAFFAIITILAFIALFSGIVF